MKKVIQGSKVEFLIQLVKRDKKSQLIRPYDLTGYVEITAKIKASSSVLTRHKVGATVGIAVVGLDTDGVIKVTLLPEATDSLPKSATGFIDIAVDKGSDQVDKFQITSDGANKSAFFVEEDIE